MSRNRQALAKMAEWAQRFEAIASSQHKSALTKDMSKATLALIEDGFRNQRDPGGRRWRRKKRPNGKPTLVDSGRMKSGFKAMVGLGKFRISNSQPYTGVHQAGSAKKNIPKRRMWPKPGRLPQKYADTYTSIFQKRFFKIATGRRA